MKKVTKVLLFSVILCLISVTVSLSAFKGSVAGTKVPVYTSHSIKSRVIGHLSQPKQVDVIDSWGSGKNLWFKVNLSGKSQGWMQARFVTRSQKAKVKSSTGEKEKLLFDAISRNDTQAVKKLLAEGADVNANTLFDLSPLIIASGNGNVEIVKDLIAAGADANTVVMGNVTALTQAAHYGHTQVVEVLLKAGADVKDKYGQTALIVAAGQGRSSVVEVLLKAGADANVVMMRGQTALSLAAARGHTSVVKSLLNCGADVNARNKDDSTPLMSAALFGDVDSVKAMIAAGADVNAKNKEGQTALMYAAMSNTTILLQFYKEEESKAVNKEVFKEIQRRLSVRGETNVEVVKILLAAGADAYAKNNIGASPLLLAWAAENNKVAEVLIQAGKIKKNDEHPKHQNVLSKKENQNSNTGSLNDELLTASSKGDYVSVKRLLKVGADVNAKDKDGRATLYYAVSSGHVETVEALLAAGANVNVKDGDGWTPLHIAAGRGHTEVAKRLLAAGANANPQEDKSGWTPLHDAAYFDHIEVLKVLLAAGANVNARNKAGTTALHLAASKGAVDCTKQLVTAGADVNARSDDGTTALLAAIINGKIECVKFLLSAKADVNVKNYEGKSALDYAKDENIRHLIQSISLRQSLSYAKLVAELLGVLFIAYCLRIISRQTLNWQISSLFAVFLALCSKIPDYALQYWHFTHPTHDVKIPFLYLLVAAIYYSLASIHGEKQFMKKIAFSYYLTMIFIVVRAILRMIDVSIGLSFVKMMSNNYVNEITVSKLIVSALTSIMPSLISIFLSSFFVRKTLKKVLDWKESILVALTFAVGGIITFTVSLGLPQTRTPQTFILALVFCTIFFYILASCHGEKRRAKKCVFSVLAVVALMSGYILVGAMEAFRNETIYQDGKMVLFMNFGTKTSWYTSGNIFQFSFSIMNL